MFQEVDEVDAQSGAFIFGRKNEPTQPQIMKARLVMAKAKQCIGLIDSEDKVCLFESADRRSSQIRRIGR